MLSPKVLTTAEAARELALTPGRVRQLARAGLLVGTRVGRDWIFSPEAVEDARKRPDGRRRS